MTSSASLPSICAEDLLRPAGTALSAEVTGYFIEYAKRRDTLAEMEGVSPLMEGESHAQAGAPNHFPSPDLPRIFVDDISAVSRNKDSARFYLLRDELAIDDDINETKSIVVAQIVMGKRSFAVIAIQLITTLVRMANSGEFDEDEGKR